MIEISPRRASRPRPTVTRLMMWVLIAALVLGIATSFIRLWPSWSRHGGAFQLGSLCVVLYLPVLPGLLIWKMRAPSGTWERTTNLVLFLVLCFFAWIGAVFLAFRSLLDSIGL